MFAQIIPVIKLPKSLDIFDYKIPEKMLGLIKIGQVVRMPFRNKPVTGLVIGIEKETKIKKGLKQVDKILTDEPVLTEKQVKLAKWISEYYCVSLATVIKTILPEIILRKIKIKNIKFELGLSRIIKNKQVEKAVKESKSNDKVLFIYDQENLKYAFYTGLIEKYLLLKKGCLIVVPEKTDIQRLLNYFPKNWKDKISIIHSELSKSQFFNEYNKIKNGSAQIVIGTRLSVFAPFKSLGLIIIDQEENPNHKQSEMNPRFSAKKVARKLSEQFKATLIYASCAPQTESFFLTLHDNFKLISLNLDEHEKNINIVDLRNEIKIKNYLSISNYLAKQIDYYISTGKKIFLFINKKGMSSSISCRDCGYIFECQDCEKPYVVYKIDDKYHLYCSYCHKKTPFVPSCPKCKGLNLKETGRGIQKVEKEVRQMFPKYSITRFDSENFKPGEPLNLKNDIIIGTHLLFKKLDWQKIGLVGVISADTLLHLPDFRSTERTFQILKKLSGYLEKKSKSKMIIQTYQPNNPAIAGQMKTDVFFFYKKELEEREIFNYPPFCRLIKLMAQDKNNQTAKIEANKIYKKLLNFIKESAIKKAEVSLPSPSLFYRIKNCHRWLITLKLPFDTNNNTIKSILSIIPDHWIIDIDPESLL
jgi:primosomal protein N' (replication factor Y)